VPERRQFIARPRLRVIAVERGGECCDRDRRDDVLCGFLAADPRSQMVDIDRHVLGFRAGRVLVFDVAPNAARR
jgi:hypothetical protein